MQQFQNVCTCWVHGLFSCAVLVVGYRYFCLGLVSSLLFPIWTSMSRRVGACGGARHVSKRQPPTRSGPSRPCQHGPDQRDLGWCCHIKAQLDLLLFISFNWGGWGVRRVLKHLEVVVRSVRCPEGGIVEDSKLLPHVLHIDLHLLHGTVEDAFGLLHGERNLFGHEVAIV